MQGGSGVLRLRQCFVFVRWGVSWGLCRYAYVLGEVVCLAQVMQANPGAMQVQGVWELELQKTILPGSAVGVDRAELLVCTCIDCWNSQGVANAQ